MGKRIQRVDIDKMNTKLLELGYQDENIHTEVQIDCTGVLWDYPEATAEMTVQAPNGEKYPVVPELTDNVVVWDVTDSDLVYAGSGKLQVTLKNGTEVIKSATCGTRIMESITATGPAPTPLENWMQRAEETAHQIALTAKDEVIEQIQDAAEEARESIPADYTQLSDDVTGLKSALVDVTGNEIINTWVQQRYIKTDVDPVNVNSPVVNSAYAYVVSDCTEGDVFTITGTGAVAAGLWTFIDAAGYKLSQSANNAVADNLIITAPANASKLVVNVKPASSYFLCKGYYLQKRISEIEEKQIYDNNVSYTTKQGYVRIDTGGVVNNANYLYTELPTIPGQIIIYNGGYNPGGVSGAGFYDINGNYIPGSGVNCLATDQRITAPANAYTLKATVGSVGAYIKFANDPPVVKQLSANSIAVVNNLTSPQIVVPATSIAVVGHQWILYFGGVICGLHDAYYVMVSIAGIDSKIPILYDDSVRLTPTSAMVGDHVCRITVRTKATGTIVADKSFTLKIIADTALTGKKAIFIGDSLTDDGYYPAEIQANLSNGGIVSVGTIEDTRAIDGVQITTHNEGRGGWTTSNYIHDSSVSGVSNPFYNPSTQTFDFGYYMSQNGFSGINIVSIYLGTNGDSSFDVTVQNLIAMAQSIHAYDADIQVIICLYHQAANQSGCGNHNGLQSSADIQRGRILACQTLIDMFDGNADYPYISIAELNFGVDGNNDYAKVTQALSARNPETVVRLNNNVHPNVYGYLKIADNLYNRMLYLLTQ